MNKTKSKFRQTAKWKNFRTRLKKEREVDEITLRPLLKGFQVHHLDMSEENYEKLEPERFSTLNRQTHQVVHWLFRYYEKDPGILFRLENIMEKMKCFCHSNMETDM